MSFYLLSWHGTLACYTGISMHPASFMDVLLRAAAPVLLHDGNQITPFGAFVDVQPVETASGQALIALKAGALYVSSRDKFHFSTTPHCDAWEHFLALPEDMLPVIHDLTTRTWHDTTQSLGTARCENHEICLQDHIWPISDLRAERCGETLTLWTEGSSERTILHITPSARLTPLMETLAERLATETIPPATTPWADLTTLREQMLVVSLAPENSAHLLYLSRLCGLFEQWDLASEFLACTMQQDNRPDLFWYAAILAAGSRNYDDAASWLEQALKAASPDQGVPPVAQRFLEPLKAGENAFPALLHTMRNRSLPSFDELFDILLAPMRLSPNCHHSNLQAYSMQFEGICAVQDIPHRLRMTATEHRLNGESYWSEISLGHARWLNKERAQADIHYAKARALAIQNRILPIHYNCGIFTWLAETDSKKLLTGTVPDQLGLSSWTWRFSRPAATPPDVCLVFGCDSQYFRYMPKLIFSLIRACRADRDFGRIELCIGIDQPTPEQLDFLSTVADWLDAHEPQLGLTFTHGRLTSQNPTTYTTIRYLMLPDVTAHYHCPVITADCDGYFPEEFISLWREMQQTTDYGFRLYAYDKSGRQHNGEPWSFGAGISYFGNPEILPEIARFLSNYLNTAYDPEYPTNWCVDQCALAQAFTEFVAPYWESLRIKFMDDGTCLMVMPHHVGGKPELLAHGGTVTEADVMQDLAAHTPET